MVDTPDSTTPLRVQYREPPTKTERNRMKRWRKKMRDSKKRSVKKRNRMKK